MIDRLVRGRVHYGWLIVSVTFVTLITTAGFRATPGVLIIPLQDEFHWSRGTISLAISIGLLLYGLTAPFSAALMETFGVRRVMLWALALIASGSAATTLIHAPWQLDLLWGVVVGSAAGAVAVPLAATVATRWFERRRGLVTGLMSASNASGQLVFLPLLAWLATHYGWRAASLAVSATALVIVLPLVALLVRDRPQHIGLQPYGATTDVEVPERPARPFRPAIDGLLVGIRSKTFWLLSGSFFICGLSTNGLIGTHLIAAAADHGLSAVTAASLLALMGIFDIVGTTMSGWLTDRYDPRILLVWYYSLRGLSLLALPYALGSNHLALVGFAIFYGLDWIATVPPTIAIAADTFGRERVGVVFGWIFAAHQLGAAFAAWAAGATRGWFGSYGPAFVAVGAICLVASAMVMRITLAPREPLPEPAAA